MCPTPDNDARKNIKGLCRRMEVMGGSTVASPSSSFHPSNCASYNPSPGSSSFPSPTSSSYAANQNADGRSLIPWLKNLPSCFCPLLAVAAPSWACPLTPLYRLTPIAAPSHNRTLAPPRQNDGLVFVTAVSRPASFNIRLHHRPSALALALRDNNNNTLASTQPAPHHT
jgi:hypothetical protein